MYFQIGFHMASLRFVGISRSVHVVHAHGLNIFKISKILKRTTLASCSTFLKNGGRSSSPASGVSRDTTDFAGHNQAVFYTTDADTWWLFHDALSAWWEKEAQDHLEARGFRKGVAK